MRYPSMSNISYSHPNSRNSVQILEDIVAKRVGRDWCLFLDRDGVINRQVVGDYVRSWRDFEMLPNAGLALKQLRDWAPHLVVVTNQQGIGKGFMRADDVAEIHQRLQAELANSGMTIDAFQVCPHLESASCGCRKPRPALVIDWLHERPHVDASLSIMVGDSNSDLELAHNVAAVVGGCASVHIGGHAEVGVNADVSFDSLWDFAIAVSRAMGAQQR